MPLSIFERDGKIAVSSPYNPQFPARARELGGIWDRGRSVWLFDPRDEERVRALCEEVYGPGFRDAAPAGPHYHGHRRRLRERVIGAGAEALPDYELLEALLFAHDPRRDTKPLAKTLIEKFGGFPEVLEADPDLLFDAGVSLAGATALKLTREAAIRLARARLRAGPVLGSSDALLDYCTANIAHSKVEEFHILFLDRKNALIKHERQGKGTVDHTPVYIREVIKRTLELGASAIILVHNHPSGDPTPSGADMALTVEIVHAAKAIGIAVHDHLIIGRGTHTSLRDIGFLDAPAIPAADRAERVPAERRRGAGRRRSPDRRGGSGRVAAAAEDP
ncbi:MAG: DNA repair protein RadC [Alphaproteobacteria bacterium]